MFVQIFISNRNPMGPHGLSSNITLRRLMDFEWKDCPLLLRAIFLRFWISTWFFEWLVSVLIDSPATVLPPPPSLSLTSSSARTMHNGSGWRRNWFYHLLSIIFISSRHYVLTQRTLLLFRVQWSSFKSWNVMTWGLNLRFILYNL